MKNIIDYLKDKIYYIMAGTIIIIILIILISSCSGMGKTYESIENSMVNAAKNYYANHKNNLPKEENGTVKVTISTLVEAELLDEVIDPQNKKQTCSGHVEVTKVGEEYSYIPFLTCKGNYEPKYLTDVVKESKTDEYGNGVYEMNGEYIYRGDDVNNYVKFNDQLWRIVKVDSDGDIKLVLAESTQEYYPWDESYNSGADDTFGVTTDYLHTNIRKVLNDYYKNNFDKDAKAKIVSKDLCVGKYTIDYNMNLSETYSVEKECSIIKEDENIGLLNVSDYQNSSLDTGCTTLQSRECLNRNYLSNDAIDTWTLNSVSNNSYDVIYILNDIYYTYANNEKRVNPVIYLNNKVVNKTGKGTNIEPYVIK